MNKDRNNKFEALASNIAGLIGENHNVSFFAHCMTRLRFTIKDRSQVQEDKIKKMAGVVGCQWSGDQFQIIIGQDVDVAYRMICEKTGMAQQKSIDENIDGQKGKKKFSIMSFFDVISACIAPILPVLIGAGMVKVVMLLGTTMGLLDAAGATYATLNFVSDAAFYFLPIYVGGAAAKKFNMNMYIGMFFGAVLVHPTFVSMCGEGAAGSIFGLPIYAGSYASSIFPVLLAVYAGSYVEKFFQKISPRFLRTMLVPMGTILIMTPISLCLLAPIGSVAGTYLANAIVWLYDTCGFFGVAILASIHPLMVMTGMHQGMGPYLFSSFSTFGFEALASPATFIDNINIGAACLAVGIKSKNVDIKTEATSSGITASVCGVTEPGLFGIVLKYRKVLYSVMIGNFIGGTIAGIFKTVCYAFAGSYGFFGLATFIGEKGMSNLFFMILAVAVGFVATFVITLVLFKDEKDMEVENEESSGILNSADISNNISIADNTNAQAVEKENGEVKSKKEEIACPIAGDIKPLSECEDAIFASGAMGKGIIIVPKEGRVYAPCAGEITTIFPTLHAIGIMSEGGAEILIHVGMDTVSMNGEGFKAHVKNGDKIKPGDLLLEFDRELIKSKGLSVKTPIIITNTDDYTTVDTNTGAMNHGETIIKLS